MLIRHLSGPLKGREQVVSDEQQRITFGRSKDCDVVFPEELTLVGRRHFALVRKASGHWSIDLFGDHYVEVDGIEAQPGQPLPEDARANSRAAQNRTAAPIACKPAHVWGRTNHCCPAKTNPLPVRLRRAVQAGIALLLAVVIAGAAWVYYQQQQESELGKRMATLWEEQAKLEAEQSKAASARISTDAQRRAERGAFLVMLQSKEGVYEAAATAWPIGPSVLATNAHIVKMRDKISPGWRKNACKGARPEWCDVRSYTSMNHTLVLSTFPSL